MTQAYSTDPGGLPPADEARRIRRRRWFEHAVMVPVGFGMIATFVARGGAALATTFGAPSWIRDNPWIPVIFVVATGSIFVLVRALRR